VEGAAMAFGDGRTRRLILGDPTLDDREARKAVCVRKLLRRCRRPSLRYCNDSGSSSRTVVVGFLLTMGEP